MSPKPRDFQSDTTEWLLEIQVKRQPRISTGCDVSDPLANFLVKHTEASAV